VSGYAVGCGLVLDGLIVFGGLADDLIYTALGEAGRYGHVLPAEGVAEHPCRHQVVSLSEAAGCPILRGAEQAHLFALAVERNVADRTGGP
jgi:hypothetical protein